MLTKDITYRNKSLFYPYWFTHNILLVHQLFNSNGSLMTHQDFMLKYSIVIPISEFNIVISAIPARVIMLFKSTAGQNPTVLSIDPTKLEMSQICLSSTRSSNHHIRSLFQKEVVSVPYVVAYWNNFVNNLDWKKIWNRYMINQIRFRFRVSLLSLQQVQRKVRCRPFQCKKKKTKQIYKTLWK